MYNRGRTQIKWFLNKQKQNQIKIGIFTAMFRFPNQKLKAPDQPQSAGEESLLTHGITQVLVQRFVHSIHASKKLFCHVIVNNYLRNVS